MTVATPNPVNDAALNAQLDITRDASIANLRTQSEETRQQYRDEAVRIADQKQRSAEVVQSNINATLDNAAVRSEAEYNQAFKNLQTAQDLALRTSAANPRETRLPLELHRQVVESTQKFLSAQADYVSTHPDKASDPAYNIQLAEDGDGGFQLVNGLDPGLAAQASIVSSDDMQGMSIEELRRSVQRPNQRQVNPNEPLVTFIDQPDGTFAAKLVTGEIFPGFKANENRDAIRKIAESKVNTRRHYENLAQRQQPPTEQQQPAQPQAQPGNDPAANPNASLTDWFLDETAKRFGYKNGTEMVADQNARYQREQQNNEVLETIKNQTIVAQFFTEHPDYPQTSQSDDAIEQIINRNNWSWTPDNMAAAHALAVQNHIYRPLTQEEIAAANGYESPARRPSPPPMIKSGSPENARHTGNEWEIPLDQLRKQALGAQTGGR